MYLTVKCLYSLAYSMKIPTNICVFRIKIINYPAMDKSIKPKIFFIVHSKSLGNYFIFIFSQEKYEYMKKGKKTYAVSVI